MSTDRTCAFPGDHEHDHEMCNDVVIERDEKVHWLTVIGVASGLALEIKTGLRHSRGSVMLVAKRHCGSARRTKKGVLRDYVEWIKENVPDYEPPQTIRDALTKK